MSAEAEPDGTVASRREPRMSRRPFWLVGLVLVGLIAGLLAGALVVDRQLRPGVGIGGAGEDGEAASSGDRYRVVPAAPEPSFIAPPALPVARSVAEREVEEAFLNYLRIYALAVWELDASRLPEVLEGQALEWVTDEVNGLKAQGRPVRIVEDERKVALGPVTETSATVFDDYLSRSVYVDPVTREPLPRTGPPTHVRQTYELRKIGGTWKIVGGTREVVGEGG